MDHLKLSSVDKAEVNAKIMSSLIEDVHSTHITTTTSQIKGLFGNSKTALFISVSEDQQLYAISFNSVNGKGWSPTSLLDIFKLKGKVEAFDVQQTSDSTFRLAFALVGHDKSRHLYYCDSFKHDLSQHELFSLPLENEVHQLYFNSNSETPDLIVMENQSGGEFCKRFSLSNNVLISSDFILPRDVKQNAIISSSFGYIVGKKAVFVAYNINNTHEVIGVRGEEIMTLFSEDEKIKGQIECIATLNNVFSKADKPQTHLFLGGDEGLYFYENASTAKGVTVLSTSIKNIQQILTFQNEEKTNLWIKTISNQLYLLEGKNNSDGSINWEQPILFRQNVLKLAPTSGIANNKNQLFLLTDEWKLMNLWQDSISSLWQEETLHLKDEIGFTKQPSYQTTIRWTNDKGAPIIPNINKPQLSPRFKIKMASAAYVEINGKAFAFKEGDVAEVIPDYNGCITIVNKASDLYAPQIYITADFLNEQIEIHPNAELIRKLDQEFYSLKTSTVNQRGKKVVPSHFSEKDLGILKQTLAPIIEMTSAGLPKENRFSVVLDKASFMAVHPNPEAFFDDLGDALRYLGSVAGNAFEKFINQGIQLAGNVFLQLKKKGQKAIEIIIKVAGDVFEFVVESFSSALKALSHLLSIIKLGIEGLLDWLGSIFNWDDIQKTQRVLENIIHNGVDYMEHVLIGNEAYQNVVFSNIQQLKNQLHLPEVKSSNGSSEISNLKSKEFPLFDVLSNDKFNWILYTIQHRIGDLLEDLIPDEIYDEFKALSKQFLEVANPKIIMDALGIDDAEWDQIKQAFLKLEEKLFSFDFDIEWMIDFFRSIASKAIGLAEDFARFLMDTLKTIVRLIRKLLNLSMDLPIVNGIFSFFGTSAPKLISVVSFMAAVPSNAVSQAITKELPFEGVEHIFENKQLFSDMIHWNEMGEALEKDNHELLLAKYQQISSVHPEINIGEIIEIYNKYAPKVATVLNLIAKGTAGQAKQADVSFPLGAISGPMKAGATLLSLTIPTGDDALLKVPKLLGQICFKLTSEPVTDVLPSFASPLTSLALTTVGNILVLVTDTALIVKHMDQSDFQKWAQLGFQTANSLGSILVDSGSALNNIGQDTVYSGFPAVLIALGTPIGQVGYVLRFASNIGTTVCKQIE